MNQLARPVFTQAQTAELVALGLLEDAKLKSSVMTALDPAVPGPGGLTGRALLIQRAIAVRDAHDRLVPFVRLQMSDPNAPDDPARSRYIAERFHLILAAALEDIEAHKIRRLIINLPPRHGKTEIASKRFIPWYIGRNPLKSVIFATYNDKFAQDIGRAVRDNLRDPSFAQVFPGVVLRTASQAIDRLEVETPERVGGTLAFVGRGGTTTGRGADLLLIDDPLKDRVEADSPTIRDRLWEWFNQVINSRMMDETACLVLIQTRWHEDDLVGRLTDPENDYFDPSTAAQWRLIDMPALATAVDDVLDRVPGEALWPARFSAPYLLTLQRQDPRGFSALYQGRPTPQGGAFFRQEWLRTYRPREMPPLSQMRIYAASDHAVSMKQGKDRTVLLMAATAENGDTYILPETIWRQMNTEIAVDNMLALMARFKPVFWWAEKSQISKSIGPFLRKRMLERNVHCAVIEVVPLADKLTRAQSIQGRMSMGKVLFPETAPWWSGARDEILRFPAAAHDDFVDALAYLGLGLQQQNPRNLIKSDTGPKEGTFGWLKQQRRDSERIVRFGGRLASGW